MDENLIRHQLVSHFMGRVKNPKLQQKIHQSHLTESTTQNFQDHSKTKQNIAEFEAKHRNLNQVQTSGGDADRMLYYPTHGAMHYDSDSYKHRNLIDNEYNLKQQQTKPKPSAPVLTSNTSRKYQTTSVANNCIGDHRYLYENDSILGGFGNGSEDSAKSQKSSKTVVSRKSYQDLRKMVTSQCKLHEVIDETLKQMGNTDIDATIDNTACGLQEQPSTQYPLTLSQCKRCTERIHSVLSQKDVMTEIDKGDLLDCRNNDRLTISVDDVVNSKVIYPMVRKLQRMYMNNLKEEMSLMEDLELLPYKVNELYKATIFKQKD